jgi:hypothetical protein
VRAVSTPTPCRRGRRQAVPGADEPPHTLSHGLTRARFCIQAGGSYYSCQVAVFQLPPLIESPSLLRSICILLHLLPKVLRCPNSLSIVPHQPTPRPPSKKNRPTRMSLHPTAWAQHRQRIAYRSRVRGDLHCSTNTCDGSCNRAQTGSNVTVSCLPRGIPGPQCMLRCSPTSMKPRMKFKGNDILPEACS